MDPLLKFTRTIVVDGKTYQWGALLRSDGYCINVRYLSLLPSDPFGQLLRVEKIPPLSQDMRWGKPDEEVENDVEGYIRVALRKGWQPDKSGLGDFII